MILCYHFNISKNSAGKLKTDNTALIQELPEFQQGTNIKPSLST
jgi:hypothetical protein